MSLLTLSGQRWKLSLFAVCMLLGAGATLFQVFLYEPLGRELAVKVAVGGMALVVFAFVFACLFITCTHCGLRLVPHALRAHGFIAWFAELLTLEKCPRCGSLDGRRPLDETPAKKRRR